MESWGAVAFNTVVGEGLTEKATPEERPSVGHRSPLRALRHHPDLIWEPEAVEREGLYSRVFSGLWSGRGVHRG